MLTSTFREAIEFEAVIEIERWFNRDTLIM
jgi:hypothetical protein